MSRDLFSQEILRLERPLLLKDGSRLQEPVMMRRSRLYPGHISLISEGRSRRELPDTEAACASDEIDPDSCRFCRPDELCGEASQEQRVIRINSDEYILAHTPYYYLPGHSILFPRIGPHSLKGTRERDWRLLLEAGVKAAEWEPDFRLGFNAGTYLCSGGSQRHLHLQLVPLSSLSPSEASLRSSVPEGISYDRLYRAFESKGLVLERAPGGGAFLSFGGHGVRRASGRG